MIFNSKSVLGDFKSGVLPLFRSYEN